MNPVGEANVESKSTLHFYTLQMSEQNHGFWQLPNIHSSAVVTVPAPARSTVQETILHNSTMSSDQKVRMKKKFKAKKILVHRGSSVVRLGFFVFLFFFQLKCGSFLKS